MRRFGSRTSDSENPTLQSVTCAQDNYKWSGAISCRLTINNFVYGYQLPSLSTRVESQVSHGTRTSIHAIQLCYQNRKEAVQSHNLPVSFTLIVVHYCPIATGIYYLIRLNMAGIQAIDNAPLVSWSLRVHLWSEKIVAIPRTNYNPWNNSSSISGPAFHTKIILNELKYFFVNVLI